MTLLKKCPLCNSLLEQEEYVFDQKGNRKFPTDKIKPTKPTLEEKAAAVIEKSHIYLYDSNPFK